MSYNPNNPNGQTRMSGSTPVVIASDQSTITISGVTTISNFPATQGISGSTSISNFPSTQTISGSTTILGNQTSVITATWSSGTTLNTTSSLNITDFNTITVALVTTTTTGGAITFEVSPDNTNWFTINVSRIDSYTVENVYTIVASTNRAWSTSVDGFVYFRIRLSTAITGTGTATVLMTAQVFAIEPIISVGQASASNLNATVVQQTLTKGTQGSTGVSTQDMKDAGRSHISLNWEEMTGTAAAESSLTNMTSGSKAGVAVTGTTYTVTVGKTLRIQSVNIYVKATSTVINLSRFRIRQAASVSNSSVIIWDCVLPGASAASVAAGTGYSLNIPIPDGLEVAGGQQITFTWFNAANTCTVGMNIIGFEY